MSVRVSTGSIDFLKSNGGPGWSSSDKNLRITNEINASFVVNSKDPSGGSIIQTETTILAPVDPNASVVMGQYTDAFATYQIGGDRIHYAAQARMINANAYQTHPTGLQIFACLIWYRLEISGGNLVAIVNYRMPQLAFPFTGDTVNVAALVGTFET